MIIRMYDFDEIRNADTEIADVIKAEMERQNSSKSYILILLH